MVVTGDRAPAELPVRDVLGCNCQCLFVLERADFQGKKGLSRFCQFSLDEHRLSNPRRLDKGPPAAPTPVPVVPGEHGEHVAPFTKAVWSARRRRGSLGMVRKQVKWHSKGTDHGKEVSRMGVSAQMAGKRRHRL